MRPGLDGAPRPAPPHAGQMTQLPPGGRLPDAVLRLAHPPQFRGPPVLAAALMNSSAMSKQGPKVTDLFRQSKYRIPATRGKKAEPSAAAVAPPQAAAAAPPADAEQDAADEATLRQFDLDSRFGPCSGITRLERWERAVELGLDPPAEVPQLVRRHGTNSLFNKDLFSEEKPF